MADNTKSNDKIDTKTKEPSSPLPNQEGPCDIDASSICSPNVSTAPPFRNMFSFASKSIELKNIACGSSQHNGNTTMAKSAFTLNPSKLNTLKNSQNDELKSNLKTDLTPKFLPLMQNGNKTENKCEAAESKSLPCTSQSNFVFGENIQDRVVHDKPKCDTLNTNGSTDSDMLFTSGAKDATAALKPNGTKSLSESAREYEESRAVKRKYEEVEIKTGEEGETNVVQISCKLFTYDTSGGGTWQERGRGVLRLNDQETSRQIHSRLVFRTSGSLRVILNTKIWSEMTVQLASNKSIRFTAFDNNCDIKVFLVTGTPDDIKQLHRYLEIRVNKEVQYQKHKDSGDIAVNEPDKKKVAVASD